MRLYNVRLLFFFLLCLLVGHTLTCHSQEGTMLESRELVYLQTDKGIYETGEDLWLKTYTLDAQSLALSDRSKTLFVEMLNAKDSIVWQEKYPILSGITEGHVYVDKDLKYHDLLQAYSCTNRVEKETKPFGIVICYRNLKKQTDDALTLFSKTQDTSGIIVDRKSVV